jgi:hypothetical protein
MRKARFSFPVGYAPDALPGERGPRFRGDERKIDWRSARSLPADPRESGDPGSFRQRSEVGWVPRFRGDERKMDWRSAQTPPASSPPRSASLDISH